jgi:hypothetical protein
MATITTVSPVCAIGPDKLMAIYSIALDSSYPTGGEDLGTTLATDFDYVHAVVVSGNDTLADNGYHFGATFDDATAVAAGTVKLTCHWQKNPADAGGADIAFPEFTNTGDLSAVGQLMITVIGK